MYTINLHGFSLEEAKRRLVDGMENAYQHQESVVRIIHGQGKHSQNFPVIKSSVRHWLEESKFAKDNIKAVFRGEEGSPFTLPNAGETIVELKVSSAVGEQTGVIDFDAEEAREARRNSKAIRADRLRTDRRKGFR